MALRCFGALPVEVGLQRVESHDSDIDVAVAQGAAHLRKDPDFPLPHLLENRLSMFGQL